MANSSASSLSLSLQSAETLYAKATNAEHARDFDTAFQSYISAAQAFLQHSRSGSKGHSNDASRAKSMLKTCLERAELIKAARKDTLKPHVANPFSTGEQQYVLDRSTAINGLRLPLRSHEHERATLVPNSNLPFAPAFSSLLPSWSKPQIVLRDTKLVFASPDLKPHHIRQNIISDCSVCSAIAVCLNHHRSFGSALGLQKVEISNGTYSFMFHLNGGWRKICIDDGLPFSAEGELLSVTSNIDEQTVDLWPAYLEKAYLAALGGYDFPGSNSSVDISMLTGWIPEHIEMDSSNFEREKSWVRLYEGFRRGCCIITLGTGSPRNTSSSTTLIYNGRATTLQTEHSYAVVGLEETSDEQRLVKILNPWTSVTSQAYTSTSDLLSPFERISLDAHPEQDPILQIPWELACTTFNGLFVNWDPDVFSKRLELHGSWKNKNGKNMLHNCLRFTASRDQAADANDHDELWCLLTRHTVDKTRTAEFIAIDVAELEGRNSEYDRLKSASNSGPKGTFTSNTHCLTRWRKSANASRLSLTVSYEGGHADSRFSVYVFSKTLDLTWVTLPETMPYSKNLTGSFTTRTAGGNLTYTTFINNPQFSLVLGSASDLALAAKSSQSKSRQFPLQLTTEGPRNVPMNVMVIRRSEAEHASRLIHLNAGDVVFSSDSYTYGVARATASIAAGHYCLIVSAYEPRNRGAFTLTVESAVQLHIDIMPSEGAGMFSKVLKAAWTQSLSGGRPKLGRYLDNPIFELEVAAVTSLKMRLQSLEPSAAHAINVTIYSSPQTSPDNSSADITLGNQIATSGGYADRSVSPGGVTIPLIPLKPGKYLVVASTFDPGCTMPFQLLVFSSAEETFTNWNGVGGSSPPNPK